MLADALGPVVPTQALSQTQPALKAGDAAALPVELPPTLLAPGSSWSSGRSCAPRSAGRASRKLGVPSEARLRPPQRRWASRLQPACNRSAGHGYLDGAQHEKRPEERRRASSFGSTVAVLQTAAAAQRWPVTADLHERLRRAFAASLPAADAAAARQERGGGDAVALLLERRQGAARSVTETGPTEPAGGGGFSSQPTPTSPAKKKRRAREEGAAQERTRKKKKSS